MRVFYILSQYINPENGGDLCVLCVSEVMRNRAEVKTEQTKETASAHYICCFEK